MFARAVILLCQTCRVGKRRDASGNRSRRKLSNPAVASCWITARPLSASGNSPATWAWCPRPTAGVSSRDELLTLLPLVDAYSDSRYRGSSPTIPSPTRATTSDRNRSSGARLGSLQPRPRACYTVAWVPGYHAPPDRVCGRRHPRGVPCRRDRRGIATGDSRPTDDASRSRRRSTSKRSGRSSRRSSSQSCSGRAWWARLFRGNSVSTGPTTDPGVVFDAQSRLLVAAGRALKLLQSWRVQPELERVH